MGCLACVEGFGKQVRDSTRKTLAGMQHKGKRVHGLLEAAGFWISSGHCMIPAICVPNA